VASRGCRGRSSTGVPEFILLRASDLRAMLGLLLNLSGHLFSNISMT
jgi:hypothetical protein